jgi:outer membrane protein assembly factor BamE (lipoprotein component of BamABCDE complex)
MVHVSAATRVLLFALCFAVVTGCTATFRDHGYIPPEEDLANVIVGVDTRDTVASSIGRPGVSGILSESGWYYIESRYRNFAWRAPEEIDRQVLAVSFDDAGVVTNIERFGLERGRVVRLSRRVTTENTQGVGFLRQAFGNLGRINPGDLFDSN